MLKHPGELITELFDILLAQANPGQGSYVLNLFPRKLRNDMVCDECSSSFAGEGIIAWAYEAYNAAKLAGLTISEKQIRYIIAMLLSPGVILSLHNLEYVDLIRSRAAHSETKGGMAKK